MLADQQAGVLVDHLSTMQPIPRAGRTDDIARGALYLASDASSFVTGIDLVIDGGLRSGNRFSAGAAARRDIYDILTRDAGTRG